MLPYAAVRKAADPESYLLDFLNSSFQAARTLGAWPGWPPCDSDPVR